MRYFLRLCVIVSVALTCANAQTNETDSVKLRTWTSGSGKKIEAEFVRSQFGMVTLKKEDGSEVKIRRMQLSKADRDWIKEAEAGPQQTDGIAADKRRGSLPVFTDGEWKSKNAVYQHENFDAVVNSSAGLTIYPKEDGKRVGKSLGVYLACYYSDLKIGSSMGRGIVHFELAPKPVMEPDKLAYEGKLKDNVDFGLYYSFHDNKISASGWCRDPKRILYPTIFRIVTSIPKSHDIPSDMRTTEQEELLEGYEFVTRSVGGQKTMYPYCKPARMGGRVKSAWIEGPLFGARKVKFEAQSPKEAWLVPWIYSKYAPWQGYCIQLFKEEHDSKSKGHRIKIAIE